MSDIELLKCNICGGELMPLNESTYRCGCCGNLFARKQESLESSLKEALGEEKYARVSAARQNLWRAMHEEYINSSSCLEYARELKALVPSDYYANFAETANGKDDSAVSDFLNKSSKEDMETYADAVLDFMTKSMTAGTTTAVCGYIDRAFTNKTSPEYTKYLNLYEKEAEKVNAGIYELTLPRDVFLAYSSADISKVLELCDYLEGQEVSCFLAMRNLRHGRGAADNYDRAIKTAMDNCRIILYVSSDNSRKIGCDAYRIEIPYIRRRDMDGAPSEYRNGSYEKLPSKYKKNRIEYLLDDYKGAPTDKAVKEFFLGYEWCRTLEDVADRVITYLTSEPETEDEYVHDEPDTVTLPSHGENGTDVKEKNVLTQVSRLISVGDFREAGERLNDLEKDEQSLYGVCPAAVYYYKILVKHGVGDDGKLANKLVSAGKNLTDDRDFRLARSCDDSPEKERLLRIEKSVEDRLTENEKKARQERERKEAEKQEKKRTEIVSGGLLFKPAEGGYSVSGAGSFRGAELCIPAEHNGSPVVSVASEAFHACMFLRKVSVPGTVKKIGGSAFWGCESLLHVELTDGLVSIGTDAFNDCKNLRSISIPDSVKVFGESAFCGCSSLAVVKLPEGITSLSDEMFGECVSLKYICIPGKVSAIKGNAFERCAALESIVIPYSVTSIGGYAFSGCRNLKRVYYTGTKEDWTVISVGSGNKILLAAERYYYSEEKPSVPGEYWHYDGNGYPVIW